jgi:hypothetical protein
MAHAALTSHPRCVPPYGRDLEAAEAAARQHKLNSLQARHAHQAPAVSQNELSVGQVLRSLP